MHSYAVGPDSETDTGSDGEPDTKPDAVTGSRPKPVPTGSRPKPVPTNIVRNLSSQEFKAKPRIVSKDSTTNKEPKLAICNIHHYTEGLYK